MDEKHFNKIFWFIVGMTVFGAAYTVYLLERFKGEVAERFADQSMIFWLSTAVNGGIGYLIGSSVTKASSKNINIPPGSKTDVTEIKKETINTEEKK